MRQSSVNGSPGNGGAALPGAFRFRLAASRDLPHYVDLLPPGLKLAPSVRRRLPEIWTTLLESEARTFPFIEDIECDHPANIVGFGLSVFVTDAFADDLIGTPRAVEESRGARIR